MLAAATVIAQTAALTPGLHEAESVPLTPYYSGAGWAQVVDGDYSVMESSDTADSVSFTASGSQIILYRELLTTGGAQAEICVDAICTTFTSVSSIDQRGVPIAFPLEDESEVTITNLDGGLLRLDSFLILAPSELSELSAPDPARQHVTLADGSIAAFDRTLSGGDVLLLALAAAQLTALLILIGVSAWKR